jgi:cell wall-associated NlpC family hydrolase
MHRHARRWTVPVVVTAALGAAAAGAATAPHESPDTTTAPAREAARSTAAARAAVARRRATAREARATASVAAAERRAARTARRRAARAQARASARRAARTRARVAVRAATSRIGRPYVFGATGPRAFDCSGLTAWAMRRAGIALPRTSFAQAGSGVRVSRSRIRPGDLVFFSTAGAGASHVGIATSRRTVVSATSHGVMRHSISDAYWGGHYVAARRVAAHRG